MGPRLPRNKEGGLTPQGRPEATAGPRDSRAIAQAG